MTEQTINELAYFLGHTNIETTKVYVNMSPKDLKIKQDQRFIFHIRENNRQAGEYREK